MRPDPHKTLAVVYAWPTGQVDYRLTGFLMDAAGLPLANMVVVNKRCIPAAYNSGVRDALRSPFDYFIFADHDVCPGKPTLPFLEAAGDVVCCECPVGNNVSWKEPHAFHCGLWRTNRWALARIAPPWFLEEYSEDGCDLIKCVCLHFRDKALAAGLSVVRAGWADHVCH